MATVYDEAPEDLAAKVDDAMKRWHDELDKAGVEVGVLVADNLIDAPVKGYGGLPASGKIRVVSLKDRVKKKYDAELVLSARFVGGVAEQVLVAAIDGFLSALELIRDKDGFVKRDDLDRPRLRVKAPDFGVWGQWTTVKRHGDADAAVRAWTHTEAAARGLGLELAATGPIEPDPEPVGKQHGKAEEDDDDQGDEEEEKEEGPLLGVVGGEPEFPAFSRVETSGLAAGEAKAGRYALVITDEAGWLYGPDENKLLDVTKAHGIESARVVTDRPGIAHVILGAVDAGRLADSASNAAEWSAAHRKTPTVADTPVGKTAKKAAKKAVKKGRGRTQPGATA